jgi:ribonuclease P protein component
MRRHAGRVAPGCAPAPTTRSSCTAHPLSSAIHTGTVRGGIPAIHQRPDAHRWGAGVRLSLPHPGSIADIAPDRAPTRTSRDTAGERESGSARRAACTGGTDEVRGLTPLLGRRYDRRAERDEPVNGHRVRLASTPAVRVFSPLSARPPLNRGRPRADEEDLSAQEARQEAGTRLPRPHGFEGWSPRARPTPREGAQAAHRLTRTGHHVPAFSALRRKADFDALGRRGSVRSTRLLVLRSLRTDRPETRIGMSTPKSLGGAVQRNRVRRRLRELIRERRDALGAGWDLLLIARPEAGTASYVELGEALGSLLERSGIGG